MKSVFSAEKKLQFVINAQNRFSGYAIWMYDSIFFFRSPVCSYLIFMSAVSIIF